MKKKYNLELILLYSLLILAWIALFGTTFYTLMDQSNKIDICEDKGYEYITHDSYYVECYKYSKVNEKYVREIIYLPIDK